MSQKAEACFAKAAELYLSEEYQDSLAQFNRAVALEPHVPKYYLHRAAAQIQLKKYHGMQHFEPNGVVVYVNVVELKWK